MCVGSRGGAPFRRELPFPEVENDARAPIVEGIDVDDLRELYFRLCWTQHGGSGLNVSLGEVEQMPAADLLWYLDRVRTERQAENEAMKKAAPKSRPATRTRPRRR